MSGKAEPVTGPRDLGAAGSWLLSADERGNDATRLGAWTEGSLVRPLVDGRSYFAVLADALAVAGVSDIVLFADWRADPVERLTDGAVTVAEALAGAARRGTLGGCEPQRDQHHHPRLARAQLRDRSGQERATAVDEDEGAEHRRHRLLRTGDLRSAQPVAVHR